MARHWMVTAYGRSFTGRSAKQAMDRADAYGAKNNLRAVSLIANYY
jgi:hypothetical protein